MFTVCESLRPKMIAFILQPSLKSCHTDSSVEGMYSGYLPSRSGAAFELRPFAFPNSAAVLITPETTPAGTPNEQN